MYLRLCSTLLLVFSVSEAAVARTAQPEFFVEHQASSIPFINQNAPATQKFWGEYGCVPTSFINGLMFLSQSIGYPLPGSPVQMVVGLSNFNSGQGVHNPLIPTLIQYGLDTIHFPANYEITRTEIGSKHAMLQLSDLASVRFPGRAIDLISIRLHEILILGLDKSRLHLIGVDPVNGELSAYDYSLLPIGASRELPMGYGKRTLWIHLARKIGNKYSTPKIDDFYSGYEVDNINSLNLIKN